QEIIKKGRSPSFEGVSEELNEPADNECQCEDYERFFERQPRGPVCQQQEHERNRRLAEDNSPVQDQVIHKDGYAKDGSGRHWDDRIRKTNPAQTQEKRKRDQWNAEEVRELVPRVAVIGRVGRDLL